MKIIWASQPHRFSFHEESIGIFDRLLIRAKGNRPSFHRRMFVEDFARIFSLFNRREGNLFEISSNDEELTARLLGDARTRYEPHSVDKTIQRMVEDIAKALIWFGESYFFLTYDHEHEKIYIASFPANRIFHFIRVYFQFLPKRHEWHQSKGYREMPSEFRILDRSKLMHFRLPRSVKRMLSSQNTILASLDKHGVMSAGFFPCATHENPDPQKNNFDFRIWENTQDYALYRATRVTGWGGRMPASSRRSDFVDCYRLIRFRRNQLKLRDGILAQLSSEFTRVGKFYRAGFDFAVTPTIVLPTVADLDELEARLSREEVGFTEVRDFCLKR